MTHSMLSHYSYPTPHGPITICTSGRGVRAVAFGEVQLAGTRRPTELSNRCATELLEDAQKLLPDAEIVMFPGGQPLYDFIISVE